MEVEVQRGQVWIAAGEGIVVFQEETWRDQVWVPASECVCLVVCVRHGGDEMRRDQVQVAARCVVVVHEEMWWEQVEFATGEHICLICGLIECGMYLGKEVHRFAECAGCCLRRCRPGAAAGSRASFPEEGEELVLVVSLYSIGNGFDRDVNDKEVRLDFGFNDVRFDRDVSNKDVRFNIQFGIRVKDAEEDRSGRGAAEELWQGRSRKSKETFAIKSRSKCIVLL
jgi:hypothetical protein